MPDTYDLVVLGSGTAAQVASSRARAAGWTVAVIDHRPFGGTCALRGCDPKKMLVSGEEAIDAARRMHGHGVKGDLQIAWPDLMAFKRSFTGPDMVVVDGRELKARHILIATGARPVSLGITGEEHVATSDDFLELETLPSRVAFIGGGYIAAEFSHLAARAGAKATILQRGTRLLPQFDPDLVGWLMESFGELGVDVRTGAAVKRVEKTDQGFLVHTVADGQEQTVAADLVVHAAGRVPDVEALDLAEAGIALNGERLQLNEFLQSVSNPRVYAAGDAAGSGPPLTPVSSHGAKVVAANLLEGNKHRPDYRGVPSVAFTLPPIASVGLSEAEAHARGTRVQVKSERVP